MICKLYSPKKVSCSPLAKISHLMYNSDVNKMETKHSTDPLYCVVNHC